MTTILKATPMVSTAVLYITTILTGGTSWYAAKLQLTDVAPIISLIYRFGAASVILLLLCTLTRKRLRYRVHEHISLAALGVMGFSVAFMFIYLAAGLITTGLIAVVYSTVVLLNTIISSVFYKSKFPWVICIAGLIGIFGITLVFLPEIFSQEWNWIGFGYAAAATVAFSFANISAVHLHKSGVEILPMTAISMGYGAIFLLACALAFGQPFSFDSSLGYLGSLLYLTLFPSVIGYTTYFAVISRLGAERGSYTMLVVPLVALAISSVAEGYRPTFLALIGTAMVLSGNYWAIITKSRPAIEQT